MKLLLLSALLVTSAVQAKTTEECLAPGSRVVMDQFPVQDQDGLGTCYANASAVLLQGSLGLANPVSYHQLALAHAVSQNRAKENGRLVSLDNSLSTRYAGEGGWVCRTIEAAKKAGFCDASSFRLDVHGGQDAWSRQEKAVLAFGLMIDRIGEQAKKMKDAEWENFTQQLAARIHGKRTLCQSNPEEFMGKKVAQLLPGFVLNKIAGLEDELKTTRAQLAKEANATKKAELQTKIDGKSAELEKFTKLRDQTMVAVASATNPDVREWRLIPEAEAAVVAMGPAYRSGMVGIAGEQTTEAFFSGVKMVPAVMAPLGTLSRVSNQKGGTLTEEELTQANNDISSRELLVTAHGAYLDCSLALDEDVAANIKPQEMMKPCLGFSGSTNPEIQRAYSDAQEIVRRMRAPQLSTTLTGRANSLMSVIAPACAAQLTTNKSQLANRRCESIVMNETMPTGTAGLSSTMSIANVQNKVGRARNWAINRLCENRPVTVDVCTDFMNSTVVNTNFCKNREKKGTETKHGNHAMAVVGYDVAEDGKVRFLVQNSWGRSCPFTNEENAAGKQAECERDAGNNLTGRFWVASEVLIQNSYDFSAITNPPAPAAAPTSK